MMHSVYSFNIHRKNSVRHFFQSYIRTDGLTDMNALHNQFSHFSVGNAAEVCLEYYR